MTQANKAGDEQRRARQQRDGECDLRADEQFAETLLAHTAGRSASAFFQGIDNIRARTLQRGIKPMTQTGEERERDGERQNRQRNRGRGSFFDREEICCQLRHERNQLPGQSGAENSGEQD